MSNRILIVDDNPINASILECLLQNYYETRSVDNGHECLELIPDFKPQLVLLDIMMPGIDGYETCRRIKDSLFDDNFTQVILISGKALTQERLRGYEMGADDYVVKPFDHDELLSKVRVHLRISHMMASLNEANAKVHAFNTHLQEIANQRTLEVIATRDVGILALANLVESRDPETGQHLERMQKYVEILVEHLAKHGPYTDQIDKQFINEICRSSPLHDIGKVGIPDAILLKPGPLTPDEVAIMQRHTVIGADALQNAAEKSRCGDFLKMAITIARHHHEHFDGTGYPDGLAGREIPLAARIVTLADAYDAMTSARVYKPAYQTTEVRDCIIRNRGTHFDPAMVDAFVDCFDLFISVKPDNKDTQFKHVTDLAFR